MKRLRRLHICVWIGALSCVLFSGCSGNTEIQTEQPVSTVSAEKEDSTYEGQEDFMAFEKRTLPVWDYEKGVYPTAFMVVFTKMSEKETEDAWSKINASSMCQNNAKIQVATEKVYFLEANPGNINPAYLEWCADTSGEHSLPRVLENPGKILLYTVYTADDVKENVLFETYTSNGRDSFIGNFRVNIADGTTVNIAKLMEDPKHPKTPIYKETAVTLDKITTEADWMFDVPEREMYLKLTKKDFEKLIPKNTCVYHYYVKSVKGSENEMREYVKSLGGTVLEDSYYE